MMAYDDRRDALELIAILGIALALAMDAFAVSVAVGITLERVHARHVFRLSFHFGLFQFLMPVLGWLAGVTVRGWLASVSPWVAFGLLTVVGGKMIWESFWTDGEGETDRADPTRGLSLVTLSVATSIDALAAGMGMALLKVSILLPSVIIGLVAAGMSVVGIRFGECIGSRLEHWAERAGGAVLIAIGARIALAHVAG
jgi:putative Mn2+ efflux pump MntP